MDKKLLIEKMRAFSDKVQKDVFDYNIKKINEQEGNLTIDLKKILYLGEIEFQAEDEEKAVAKPVFMTIEELDGQIQYKYYDGEGTFLALEKPQEEIIMPSGNLVVKDVKEQTQILQQMETLDKMKGKSVEELEGKLQKGENSGGLAKAGEKQDLNSKPKVPSQPNSKSISDLRLTKSQLGRLGGPKTSSMQEVNGRVLRNTIGLSGVYIQFVDADILRNEFPDYDIPAGQKYVPIDVSRNDTGTIIGNDKLEPSKIEGKSSSKEYTTVTNEGEVKEEQNEETFNITSVGGMETLSIGYGETPSGKPYREIKHGTRDREQPTEIAYSELELAHTDDTQDYDAQMHREDASQGTEKAENTIRRAQAHGECEDLKVNSVDSNQNNNNIHEEDVLKYAMAFNIRNYDEHGYPTTYDTERASHELEKLCRENPGKSVEEIIEAKENEDVKAFGPKNSND